MSHLTDMLDAIAGGDLANKNNLLTLLKTGEIDLAFYVHLMTTYANPQDLDAEILYQATCRLVGAIGTLSEETTSPTDAWAYALRSFEHLSGDDDIEPATNTSAHAKDRLAELLVAGNEQVNADPERAGKLFFQAKTYFFEQRKSNAETDCKEAFNLAAWYAKGMELTLSTSDIRFQIPINDRESLRYLRIAAQTVPQAQYEYGVILWSQRAFPDALIYWQTAAQAKHPPAIKQLQAVDPTGCLAPTVVSLAQTAKQQNAALTELAQRLQNLEKTPPEPEDRAEKTRKKHRRRRRKHKARDESQQQTRASASEGKRGDSSSFFSSSAVTTPPEAYQSAQGKSFGGSLSKSG